MFHKGFSFEPMIINIPGATTESEELLGTLNINASRMGTPDGHGDRVAMYALAIGRRLDLSTKGLNTLKIAAILHDVGKVGISQQIVDKSGELSEREFEIMRLHSTIAVKMLENVDGLEDSIPLIKHHHERFDGKGYPDGLEGPDIPLGARIIGVAETFDILISGAPWRNAMMLEDAEAEMRDCAGTQFDPMVVDALLSIVDAKQVDVPCPEEEVKSPRKLN